MASRLIAQLCSAVTAFPALALRLHCCNAGTARPGCWLRSSQSGWGPAGGRGGGTGTDARCARCATSRPRRCASCRGGRVACLRNRVLVPGTCYVVCRAACLAALQSAAAKSSRPRPAGLCCQRPAWLTPFLAREQVFWLPCMSPHVHATPHATPLPCFWHPQVS